MSNVRPAKSMHLLRFTFAVTLLVLANSSSAGGIPSFAIGEFSRTWENSDCKSGKDTRNCSHWPNTDFVAVDRVGSSASVSFEIYGAHGHICSGSGIAEWKKGALRMALFKESSAPACQVWISFSKAGASIRSNDAEACRSMCGPRAQINADLPKTAKHATRKPFQH